mmetsp:Transcript_2211/g.4655  ORF Transcript_2211/g.4655 Transcript_2211/m.4655 type:complete len:92 (-) Transcript_2211:92-367(-)
MEYQACRRCCQREIGESFVVDVWYIHAKLLPRLESFDHLPSKRRSQWGLQHLFWGQNNFHQDVAESMLGAANCDGKKRSTEGASSIYECVL